MFRTLERSKSNLAMLEKVARKLGNLNNDVVYLGGCTIGLFITDPLSLDVRATFDVDCIVDILSLGQYHKFEIELTKKGFKKSLDDDVICRWRYDEMILDVMPTNERVLGFGNPWYKSALENSKSHKMVDDLIIQSITASYFIATKIEAFRTRGNNDLLGSHDFEDIISVVAGRIEICDEVASEKEDLKLHLKQFFQELLKNDQFERILPGHLSDGPVTFQRVQTVKNRIKMIIDS